MKLTIERATLLKSLAHVQGVVERRNTIPILANIKLDAGNDSLSLNATDMDLGIAESVTAEVLTPGTTTAPAHTFHDIVRKLPEGAQVEVQVEGERDQLTIRAGRSRFSLACRPAEDFPVMAGGEEGHTFALPAAELRALVDRTRFAISTEETRYYLNGIYLHAADQGGTPVLRAVATDGHRLARVEVPLPEGAEGMPGVIIPRKTVNELRKLVEDLDDAVAVTLSETRIRFAFSGAELTSKLIDGTFPEYQRVIPAGNDRIMVVDRKTLAEAADRVSTISSEKSRAVKLTIEKGRLVLSATSPDQGSAVEELEAEFEAAPLEIGFNSRYMLDILGQVEGDGVRFELADSGSPTLVRDAADMGAIYVLMPMRV